MASLVTMAAVFALMLAGCGGDASTGADDQTYTVSSDTTLTTAKFAKESFVPRVNRICRQAWITIFDNFTEYSSTQNRRMSRSARFKDAARLSLLAGITFHIFDNIYQLGAPRGEEREGEELIGSLLSATERGQKKLEPVGSIPQIVELFDEYNRRARSYGLDDCLVDEAHLGKLKLG